MLDYLRHGQLIISDAEFKRLGAKLRHDAEYYSVDGLTQTIASQRNPDALMLMALKDLHRDMNTRLKTLNKTLNDQLQQLDGEQLNLTLYLAKTTLDKCERHLRKRN